MSVLERRLKDASSVDEVRVVRQSVREFESQVARLEITSRVSRHEADLADAEASLAKLRNRTANFDQTVSDRLGPGERLQIDGLFTEAAGALAQKALAKCSHLLRQADDRITAHETRLLAAFTREQEDYARYRTAIDDAADRLDGLSADPSVSRWCAAEIGRVTHVLAKAEAVLRAGRYTEVELAVGEILRVADEIPQRAMDIQLEEDRRQYVVNGIIQALGQLGFVVQNGSPALEQPGVESSSVIIQARRVGGGAVAVSIPQHGDIWYDVDGYPKRYEGTREGQAIVSCDEAETQLTRLHEVISSEFGIETDGLHWQGKDPERLQKQADQLPGDGTADSKPGGRV
jgi:hypothetical protein